MKFEMKQAGFFTEADGTQQHFPTVSKHPNAIASGMWVLLENLD